MRSALLRSLKVLAAISSIAACSAFGAASDPDPVPTVDDGGTKDAEPVLSPEPSKVGEENRFDAAVYDGPILEGGAVADSSRCTSDRGPPMVELLVGSASYCVDSTEVTVAQYTQFLSAINDGFQPDQPGFCAYNTNFAPNCADNHSKNANQPINCVDWCDANAFCKWAGKRLCGKIGGGANAQADMNNPSRSQWFAACSAGGAYTYAYGDPPDNTACRAASMTPADVKSFPKCEGGFPGLFDMTGNVGEWEDSCESTNGPDDLCLRRGGDIQDPPEAQRCGQLHSLARKSRYESGGIRCCKD